MVLMYILSFSCLELFKTYFQFENFVLFKFLKHYLGPSLE